MPHAAFKSLGLKFWDRDESLTTFLWLLVAFIFVIGPLSRMRPGFELFTELLFGVVLLAGVRVAISSRTFATIAGAAVLFTLMLSIFEEIPSSTEIFSHHALVVASESSKAAAIALLLYVVANQTVKDGPVTSHRVKGAIATYLLIGLLWAKLYTVTMLAVPKAFSGIPETGNALPFVYYSFVTLTTVGYGDILPTHEISRALSNAEGLIGQLFPAIFIARIVTLQIESRK